MIDVNKLFKIVLDDVIRIGAPISNKIIPIIFIDKERYDRVGACYKYNFPERYEIHLSEDVLNAKENDIKGIIAHEILHTCCMKHNGKWKLYQLKMNRNFGYNIKTEYSWCEILED